MLRHLTSWSYHHRRIVVGVWVALLVAINALSMARGGEPQQDFLSPGTDSKAAIEMLDERFPDRAGDTITVVFRDDAGGIEAAGAAGGAVVAELAAMPHVTGAVSPWDADGSAQVSPDGSTGYAVLQLDTSGAQFPGEVAAEMIDMAEEASRDGLQVELSGQAIENGQTQSMGAEGPGLAIAALVLLIAFGSLVAMGLPLATALFGVGVGLALGALLANVVDTPEWASSVAIMIGLGVGIDYALLIVTRFRTELGRGQSPAAAARVSMATAGRSVVFAGLTVVVSLLGMLTMNQPYVPGVAFSAVITVLAVLAAALTLLPALLGFAGRGIDRLRVPFLGRRAPAGEDDERGFWHRWSRGIQRHPVLAGLAGTAALGVLILPVATLQLGYPDAGNDPAELTTRRAHDLMTEGFGPGVNAAFVLVADQGDEAAMADLDRLRGALAATPGVAAVSDLVASPGGDAAVLSLTPTTGPQDPATKDLLHELRSDVVPGAVAGTGIDVKVGGRTAADVDQTDSIAQRLPFFIGAVIALSLILLVAVFRSVVVALQAAVLNLASIVAAYGVVAYAAQGGWLGHLVGIDTATPIPAFIPMMMFAILFGLSMDYEVFLLSRVREEYLKSGDNSEAVVKGLASTGKVITAAALIMTAVFGAFVLDDQIFLKIIGVGMAAAVIVDATIIRLLLVPSVMTLFGDRNWWIPAWLDRVVPRLDVDGADEPAAAAPIPPTPDPAAQLV